MSKCFVILRQMCSDIRGDVFHIMTLRFLDCDVLTAMAILIRRRWRGTLCELGKTELMRICLKCSLIQIQLIFYLHVNCVINATKLWFIFCGYVKLFSQMSSVTVITACELNQYINDGIFNNPQPIKTYVKTTFRYFYATTKTLFINDAFLQFNSYQ